MTTPFSLGSFAKETAEQEEVEEQAALREEQERPSLLRGTRPPSIRASAQEEPALESEEDPSPMEKVTLRAQKQIPKAIAKGEKNLERAQRQQEMMAERTRMLDGYEGMDAGLDLVEAGRNAVNFIIGDDAAVVGFRWDEEGVSWNLDNAMQQWSEQPAWDSVLKSVGLATWALPVFGAVSKSLRFGGLGRKFTNRSFQYVSPDGTKSFRWFEKFKSQADEVAWLQSPDGAGIGYLQKGMTPTKSAIQNARVQVEAAQRSAKMTAMQKAMDAGKDTFQWGGEDITIGTVDKAKAYFHKQFANKYFQLTNIRGADDAKGIAALKGFQNSLDELYRAEDWGKFFNNVPQGISQAVDGSDSAKKIAQYMYDGTGDVLDTLDAPSRAWLEGVTEYTKATQKKLVESGMYGTGEVADAWYAPLIKKGKAQEDIVRKTARISLSKSDDAGGKLGIKLTEIPTLDSDRFLRRIKTDDEARSLIAAGEVITDPRELFLRGTIVSRQMIHNHEFMRDYILDRSNVVGRTAFSAMTEKQRKAANLIDLETIDGISDAARSRLKRMISKVDDQYLEEGKLPLIDADVFEGIFGKAGMLEQSKTAASVTEAMIAFAKWSKTVTNPSTQFANVFGNMVLQSVAGYNPTSTQSLGQASKLSRAFYKIANLNRRLKKDGISSLDDLMNDSSKLSAMDLGKMTVKNSDGKSFTYDLAKELADPEFRKFIEDGVFDNAEGFGRLSDIYDNMSKGMGKSFVGKLLGAKTIPGVGRAMDEATTAYLLGDMVPKAQLYFKALADGMSKEGAALYVARYMPMYGTTGAAITKARKNLFPWATFPAESLRVFKNGIQDNPLRVLPWLQAVDTLQSTQFLTGGVGSQEELETQQSMLPMWARTPTSIVGDSNQITTGQATAAGAGAGLIGGVVAGAAMGAKGGGAGALAGAALGGVAGYSAAQFFKEKDEADTAARAMTMKWLPYSSFMLARNIDPERPVSTAGEAISYSPVEPFAMLMPLLNVIQGRTSYGEEIVTNNGGEIITKTLAGLVSFAAPPLIQTYGYRTTSPDVPLLGGERVQGIGVRGAAAGAAVGAAAGAGLGGAGGAAVGAGIGGVLGGIANVSRVNTDLMGATDPRTMRPKDTFADFFLNNFSALKTYAAAPENMANEKAEVDKIFSRMRSTLRRQAMYHLTNNNEEMTTSYLNKIQGLFVRQHPGDPRKASMEFSEFLEDFVKNAGQSPIWGKLSTDDLVTEIRKQKRVKGDLRGRAQEELLQTLQAIRSGRE